MKKEIKIGQKLYHFSYGPMTVINITHDANGEDYIETVIDDPKGIKQNDFNYADKRIWLLDTVGHWLFESKSDVGSENNDFDWKKIWPGYKSAPVNPVRRALDKSKWHTFFGVKSKDLKAGSKDSSPVGLLPSDGSDDSSPVGFLPNDGSDDSSPVGIIGSNGDLESSPVGVIK